MLREMIIKVVFYVDSLSCYILIGMERWDVVWEWNNIKRKEKSYLKRDYVFLYEKEIIDNSSIIDLYLRLEKSIYIANAWNHFSMNWIASKLYPQLNDTSRKPVRCTEKLLKIRSKDILIFFFFFEILDDISRKIVSIIKYHNQTTDDQFQLNILFIAFNKDTFSLSILKEKKRMIHNAIAQLLQNFEDSIKF